MAPPGTQGCAASAAISDVFEPEGGPGLDGSGKTYPSLCKIYSLILARTLPGTLLFGYLGAASVPEWPLAREQAPR